VTMGGAVCRWGGGWGEVGGGGGGGGWGGGGGSVGRARTSLMMPGALHRASRYEKYSSAFPREVPYQVGKAPSGARIRIG